MDFIPFAHVTCQEKVFTRRLYSSRNPSWNHIHLLPLFSPLSSSSLLLFRAYIIDRNLSARCHVLLSGFEIFLFSLKAVRSTDTGLGVIQSVSQQRLTVSILADWVRQRAVRITIHIQNQPFGSVFSPFLHFHVHPFYRWYGKLTQMLNQFLTCPPLMSNRAPSSSRPLSYNFAHWYRNPSSHVYPFISRRSSITPLAVPQYPKAEHGVGQI